MTPQKINRILAGGVFAFAFILYSLTVAPTASFWDTGEFIAIANRLEVSHPPGAPFYMLLGRMFSMFIPTAYIALTINMMSVLASALTILLTYLVIVRLIEMYRRTTQIGDAEEDDLDPKLAHWTAWAGGIIGAIGFAVTDSFWFNAVEAEVYALSMFFTAIVIWLILYWAEKSRLAQAQLQRGVLAFGSTTERWLILIAYVFGLAIGVHLLNLLAIFTIALIIFFQRFDKTAWSTKERWLGIIATGVISCAAFFVIYPGIITKLPTWAGDSGAPLLFLLALVGALLFALYYTQKNGYRIANMVALCLTMMLIGYSSYTLIFIRSAADPPIDENDPENAEGIVYYLKREQYGDVPLFMGATYNNRLQQVDTREGNAVLFPRRHSPAPNHMREYARYDSDWDYFWRYQINHMYTRYFLWNFVGRASDVQNARWITGFSDRETEAYLYQTPSEKNTRNVYFALPLLLGVIGLFFHFMRDWRRAFSILILFIVTGLGIIFFLNQKPIEPRERDYSFAANFFAFSLWMGIGATGLLELVAMWLRDLKSQATRNTVVMSVAGVIFLAVPGWMLFQNYDDHDRSGRYAAPDYAYNLLQSLEPNAIVFTNGDNDTFPLWYLQEVEGIRTDVRVANLSLLNTPWYIKQLKNQWSRESAPIPMTLSDPDIEAIEIIPWRPREVELPVPQPQALITESGMISPPDTALIESPMRWSLIGRPYSDEFNLLYTVDQAVLSILEANARAGWTRPVYFAITASPDSYLNLEPYFQLEGLAYRVVPIRHDRVQGRIVPDIMLDRLNKFRFTNLNNPDVHYDENIRRMMDNLRIIYGYTARELMDQGRPDDAQKILNDLMEAVPPDVIAGDDQSLSMMGLAYEELGDETHLRTLVDYAIPHVLHQLPRARSDLQFQRIITNLDWARSVYQRTEDATAIANLDTQVVQTLETQMEPRALQFLSNARDTQGFESAARYIQVVQFLYADMEDFEAASRFSDKIADLLQDDIYRQSPEELRQLYQGDPADSTDTGQ